MADKYLNFAELNQQEEIDRDFRVRVHRAKSDTVIAAPHGGGIEPGTSEVAEAIAAADYSFYAFEGRKHHGNGSLHITSSHFDEPQCIALITNAKRVVAIHGESGSKEIVCLGGRDEACVKRIQDALRRNGFQQVKRYARFKGLDRNNICNRNKSRAGIQIELSHGYRRSFFRSLSPSGRQNPTDRFYEFVNAVRTAL